ncbi:MAG: hypothetical protein ACI4J7_03085 [Ruminiclostridium sp.]
MAQQSRLLHIFIEKAPDFFRFSFLDLFFRTPIYGLTVGFARRCNPFGRQKGARTLTCIKIISAFSAEIEPKGVRVLPTSCGGRTAGHDACYSEKEAENAVIFTCENVLQSYCCKLLFISPKYRRKRLIFCFVFGCRVTFAMTVLNRETGEILNITVAKATYL